MASDTRLGNITAGQWSPTSERWKNLYPPHPAWLGLYIRAGSRGFGFRQVLEVVYDHISQDGGASVIWEGYGNLTGFYDHARKKLMHPLLIRAGHLRRWRAPQHFPGRLDAHLHDQLLAPAATSSRTRRSRSSSA
jgi:hypothetical protein